MIGRRRRNEMDPRTAVVLVVSRVTGAAAAVSIILLNNLTVDAITAILGYSFCGRAIILSVCRVDGTLGMAYLSSPSYSRPESPDAQPDDHLTVVHDETFRYCQIGPSNTS